MEIKCLNIDTRHFHVNRDRFSIVFLIIKLIKRMLHKYIYNRYLFIYFYGTHYYISFTFMSYCSYLIDG